MSENKYRSNHPKALVRGERVGDFWNMYNHEGKMVAYEYDPTGNTSASWIRPRKLSDEEVAEHLRIDEPIEIFESSNDFHIERGDGVTIEYEVEEVVKETRELLRKAKLAEKYESALRVIHLFGTDPEEKPNYEDEVRAIFYIAHEALYGDDSE